MEDKRKLEEEELLKVTGGTNQALVEECKQLKKAVCKKSTKCRWVGYTTTSTADGTFKDVAFPCRPL